MAVYETFKKTFEKSNGFIEMDASSKGIGINCPDQTFDLEEAVEIHRRLGDLIKVGLKRKENDACNKQGTG